MITSEIGRRARDPLWVSRAVEPTLRDQIVADFGATELPIMRGRTVVPGALDGTVILGHPNYLGRFEDPPDIETLWIVGGWSSIRPLPAGTRQVSQKSGEANDASALVHHARRLAKQLRQVRGVELLSMPETPVIVALTSFNPPSRLDDIEGVSRLGSRFRELPGGVRIEIPSDVTGETLDGYAASVVGAFTKES